MAFPGLVARVQGAKMLFVFCCSVPLITHGGGALARVWKRSLGAAGAWGREKRAERAE